MYRTRAKAVSSKPIFNAGTERFVRDWRTAIVTITVRDQRYRQHDPILGVIPLRLTDMLQTSSQVTRWLPLDGGIGFGRARISLLFRSVETRLPPNMLGWEVGTFEFLADRILATGFTTLGKLNLRTGGSSGSISKNHCVRLAEGDGVYWDTSSKESKNSIRLPVKFRYRSPIVFELHQSGKRGAAAYAMLWLHHLVDNESTPVNIPIWTTKNGERLIQNYVTGENSRVKEGIPGLEDLKEIGRLNFRCQFKAGTDESHKAFVVDNESRETYETWEACLAEGVRSRRVEPEVPSGVSALHEESLTQGRDVLEQADREEKRRWLTKDGQDWSGAFGHDPKAYMDSSHRKRAEPGVENPVHDPIDPSSDDDNLGEYDDSGSDSEPDLGVHDATNTASGKNMGASTQAANDSLSNKETAKVNKNSEKRKHRGLMQWKPVRNIEFAKNEAKFALKRAKRKMTGSLSGREPDVETEV